MTVASAVARNDYLSSGIAGPYAFTFPIQAASHLVVLKRDLTTGGETTLTQGVDYTLSGTSWANGGSFTLAAVLATGYAITARRVVPLTQLVDLRNQGAFFAEVHESEFDLLTQADQQQQDQIDRALKLPATEAGTAANTTLPAATLRANKALFFDASGNPTVAAGASVASIPDVSLMQVVDTVAALRALAIPAGVTQYRLRGYYAAGDGGGGFFYWSAGSSAADDGGAVIRPSSLPASGRWLRIVDDIVSVRWFGALGDGVTDDAPAINAALVFARTLNRPGTLNQVGGCIRFSKGRFLIKQTISVVEGDILLGDQSGLDSAPLATASAGTNIVVSTTLAGGATWNNSVAITVTGGGPLTVRDIGFNGTQTVTNSTWIKSGDGATNIGLTQGHFRGLRVIGFTNAVQAYKFFDVDFNDCGFESNEVDFNILGTGAFDDFSSVRFANCTFYAPGTAHFQCSGGATPKKVSFSSCEFMQTVAGVGKVGFLVYDAAITDWQFSACSIYMAASNYFLRVIDATATIDGVSFNGCGVSGGNLIGIPAVPAVASMKAIRLVGTKLRDSLVSLDSCSNGFKAVGCDFEGASTLTLNAAKNSNLVGCDFSLCTGTIFAPTGVHDGITVVGNTFPAAYTTFNFNSTNTRVAAWANTGVPDFSPFGSVVYDPPSLADGAGATTTVTVTGAALGDYAVASFSLDLQGITVTAWVSAANTVSVRFQNESGGVLDLASGTLRAAVRKV